MKTINIVVGRTYYVQTQVQVADDFEITPENILAQTAMAKQWDGGEESFPTSIEVFVPEVAEDWQNHYETYQDALNDTDPFDNLVYDANINTQSGQGFPFHKLG